MLKSKRMEEIRMITFNNAIDNLKPSASIKYIEKAKIMKMNGENVIGLSGGDPDFPTPLAR